MALPKRKQIRLHQYDYSSPGAYFVTVCTRERKCILSRIAVGADALGSPLVMLTDAGRIAEKHLLTTDRIKGLHVEKYVIMPNHIHLIVHKTNGKSICDDVRSFKGLVTKKIGKSIWQDSFYDHVIRDEADYLIKWNYIEENPEKWAEDEYYL